MTNDGGAAQAPKESDDDRRRAAARLVAARVRGSAVVPFSGAGHRLGHGEGPATEGAAAFLERQRLPEVRSSSAAGTQLEESIRARRRAQDEYLSTPAAREAATGRGSIPQPSAAGTSVEGQLRDWRATKDSYLSSPEARAALRSSFPAPVPPPAAAPVAAAAPVFDATAATALATAHPPAADQRDARAWIARIPEAAEAAGFDYSEAHFTLAQAAFVAAGQAASAARAAAVAAADARGRGLVAGNSDTWVLNPVRFTNGITRADVEAAADGAGVLNGIGQRGARANGPAGRIAVELNRRHHTHISGGSWGLAFIYVVEDDYTVTPYVYDIAQGRAGNTYPWRVGATGYDSDAPVPASQPLP